MSDIKIITEPSVYLVGKQELQNEELNRFLSDHGVSWQSDTDVDAEYLVETAGRLCYMSFAKPRPGGNKAYIGHILESSHGSVTEHAVWNFIFTGVSRSLSHELVRHRAGMSPSQLSQRYVDESVAEYVEPDVIAADPELHAIWLQAVSTTHEAYVTLAERLTEKFSRQRYEGGAKRAAQEFANSGQSGPALTTEIRKAARQAARSVLPNATETKLFCTFNARALRHFIEMRASRHADVEIRKLANAVWRVMEKESPNLFGDYVAESLPDGTFSLTTDHRKV